jgi:UDP-N-acetylmuramoyl-tripeptide--D-alanyl-D-alanine ligase
MTVVGITGSSGKTSTKDLIAHLLREAGNTVATLGNFNNEIGLPLTVGRIESDTRFLVLEMGARGIGHIGYLTGIAPPSIGVVLNVGTAHLLEFGGVEAIAQGKGELVEALPGNGLAVLNADDPRVRAMTARTQAGVTLFGFAPDAAVRAENLSTDRFGTRFTLSTPEGTAQVAMRLHGEHQVSNALAAAAVARHAGLSTERIAAALGTATAASRWRMEVTERPDGVTIVNDAYNANPQSVQAALKTVMAMAEGRRAVAVLGRVGGLGDIEESEHLRLGALAAELGIGRLVTVGGQAAAWMRDAARDAGLDAVHVPGTAEALAVLDTELVAGDIVLVKASRDVGLEVLAQKLAASDSGH